MVRCATAHPIPKGCGDDGDIGLCARHVKPDGAGGRLFNWLHIRSSSSQSHSYCGKNRPSNAVMKTYLLIAAAYAALTALPVSAQDAETPEPALYPTPEVIPDSPIMKGDSQLTCPQILAEARSREKQLDIVTAERDSITYKKGAETRALETAGMAAGMALPGPLGQAAATAALMGQMATTKKDAKTNYGDVDKKWDWVLDRMTLMQSLYQRKCLRK
jgi:hypothetical protein